MAGTSKLTAVIVNLLVLLLMVGFFTQQPSGTASNDPSEKRANIFMQTHNHHEHDNFHNIVATQAGMTLLKEHLTSFEQIGTNKKSQDDEVWNKVPPEGEEPHARVIKVTDLHWREHDRVGTKHHSTDSRLIEAAQISAAVNLAPTCVTEATATFTANFDNPVADHKHVRHLPLQGKMRHPVILLSEMYGNATHYARTIHQHESKQGAEALVKEDDGRAKRHNYQRLIKAEIARIDTPTFIFMLTGCICSFRQTGTHAYQTSAFTKNSAWSCMSSTW